MPLKPSTKIFKGKLICIHFQLVTALNEKKSGDILRAETRMSETWLLVNGGTKKKKTHLKNSILQARFGPKNKM